MAAGALNASGWIRALLAATVAVGVTMVTGTILHDRQATLDQAARTQTEVAVLMEQHTRSALETDAAVLSQLETMLQQSGIKGLIANPRTIDQLRRVQMEASAIHSVMMLDPSGKVIAGSMLPAGDNPDRSDRDYFRAVKAPASAKDFVSPMIVGRISGRTLFAVSRRVDAADGGFLGVVQSSIDADYFLRFYRRLNDDPKANFGIFKEDGAVVLRHPYINVEEAPTAGRNAIWRQKTAPAGNYVTVSSIDGVERVVAYRRLDDYGLVLTAGQSVDTVLAPWRGRSLRLGAFGLSALLLLLGLGWAAQRSARQAEEAKAQAAVALKAKANFFAAASHDLRQPYQAMRLFWAVLEAQAAGIGHARLQDTVSKLGAAMDAGDELLNALFDVAVLETGGAVPHVEDFAVQPLLDAEQASFTKLAEARGLTLRVVRSNAILHSDPVLLGRVLRNLLVNAIKYTDRGGIVMGCRKRGDQVLLQVWDSGKGIPADKLGAIFEDLYQIDNSARSRAEGPGLGLSVVARTVALLGHGIEVKSQLGRGSVFTVTVQAGGMVTPPPMVLVD